MVVVEQGEVFATYAWKGVPIQDIEAWAQSHQDSLVKYRFRKRYFSPERKEEVEERSSGRMPRSFFESIRLAAGESIELQE